MWIKYRKFIPNDRVNLERVVAVMVSRNFD